jgi:hypothetical protein
MTVTARAVFGWPAMPVKIEAFTGLLFPTVLKPEDPVVPTKLPEVLNMMARPTVPPLAGAKLSALELPKFMGVSGNPG